MVAKGKGLTYEAQEPSFLRNLRARASGLDPARHEQPTARPHRAKLVDDDDEPTYVDESNDVVSHEQYKALMAGETTMQDGTIAPDLRESTSGRQDQANSNDEHNKKRAKQEIVEVGKPQKKRKIIKVGGQEDEEEVAPAAATLVDRSKKRVKKPAKKAVPLSFGGQDDAD